MKHHVLGEDRDFEWEGNKTWGKLFKQPVVGTLNFEVSFNEDFSEREGVLRPLKMKFLKLRLSEKRTNVTPEYVEYQGLVRGGALSTEYTEILTSRFFLEVKKEPWSEKQPFPLLLMKKNGKN
jgi:hypothetical protein